MQVAIIENGGANFLSVITAIEKLGAKCSVTRDAKLIQSADAVLLPGAGSAGFAMQALAEYELIDVIRGLTQPVLGICLGMQLLFEHSAEGDVDCLGLIPGVVRKFDTQQVIVPHMGWNTLQCDTHKIDDPIIAGIGTCCDVYFVHSYYAAVSDVTLSSCDYAGGFSAIVRQGNFYGMQFHPEKSGPVGLQLLKNFIGLVHADLSCD